MEALKQDLKEKIVLQLNLENIKPSEIVDDQPLFVEGLGLDSIDALELIVMLDKTYGVKLESPESAKAIFKSVNTMADYLYGLGIRSTPKAS